MNGKITRKHFKDQQIHYREPQTMAAVDTSLFLNLVSLQLFVLEVHASLRLAEGLKTEQHNYKWPTGWITYFLHCLQLTTELSAGTWGIPRVKQTMNTWPLLDLKSCYRLQHLHWLDTVGGWTHCWSIWWTLGELQFLAFCVGIIFQPQRLPLV